MIIELQFNILEMTPLLNSYISYTQLFLHYISIHLGLPLFQIVLVIQNYEDIAH